MSVKAEWSVIETAKMSDEQNLRNVCRQFEQKYVDWREHATYRGYAISYEWPSIGELGRYMRDGVIVRFVTTHKRTMQVQSPDEKVLGDFPLQSGLARNLYVCAGALLDLSDHCEPDGTPCHCALCQPDGSE